MGFIIKLAFKNLTRYTRRTIITAVALAFGLSIFILIDSMLKGAEVESERNLIWYETGSAQIVTEEYWEDKDRLPLKHAIENPEEIYKFLEEKNIPYAPRTIFAAELNMNKDPWPEDGSMQVRVQAIDPVLDSDVYKLADVIEAGTMLKRGMDGIVLGSWIAEDLGAEVGYPVTLVTRSKDGYYQTIDIDVAGIINSANPAINRYGVYLPLDTADFYLQMDGSVTSISLKYPDDADVFATSKGLEQEIKNFLQNGKVLTWGDLAEDYLAMAAAKRGGSSIILFLVFIIAAVGISNTMLMSIFERIREIGMMRALGMKDRSIKIAFLIEAAGIGILGSLMGVIVGAAVNWPFVIHGLDYSWMIRDFDVGYRISAIFYGVWTPDTFIQAFCFGALLSALVAILPVRRAFKRSITQCLRDQ